MSKSLCKLYGIRGYPTLKYITADDDPENPRVYEFSGKRSINKLEDFVGYEGYKKEDAKELPRE